MRRYAFCPNSSAPSASRIFRARFQQNHAMYAPTNAKIPINAT
jgi:hypothetical protein